MKNTENYALYKPDEADFYNVKDFNQNMDILDAKVKEIEDTLGKKVSTGIFNNHLSDSNNPHNVTARQLGLDNVPNVATNDQTPTYTAASTLAALVSGEKLSVGFGKIAKAISTLISHISTNAASAIVGHVKLTNSSAVTDSTGFALPATEKNASIAGTLANLISGAITRISALETAEDVPYELVDGDNISVTNYNLKKKGGMVTGSISFIYNGADTLNNVSLFQLDPMATPTISASLLGINANTGVGHIFIVEHTGKIRGTSVDANNLYTRGQQIRLIGNWIVN